LATAALISETGGASWRHAVLWALPNVHFCKRRNSFKGLGAKNCNVCDRPRVAGAGGASKLLLQFVIEIGWNSTMILSHISIFTKPFVDPNLAGTSGPTREPTGAI
jgi:hypothetical protein